MKIVKIASEIVAANVERALLFSYLKDSKHTIERLLKNPMNKFVEVQSLFNLAEMYLDKAREQAEKLKP